MARTGCACHFKGCRLQGLYVLGRMPHSVTSTNVITTKHVACLCQGHDVCSGLISCRTRVHVWCVGDETCRRQCLCGRCAARTRPRKVTRRACAELCRDHQVARRWNGACRPPALCADTVSSACFEVTAGFQLSVLCTTPCTAGVCCGERTVKARLAQRGEPPTRFAAWGFRTHLQHTKDAVPLHTLRTGATRLG